jgi:hypothetical protein
LLTAGALITYNVARSYYSLEFNPELSKYIPLSLLHGFQDTFPLEDVLKTGGILAALKVISTYLTNKLYAPLFDIPVDKKKEFDEFAANLPTSIADVFSQNEMKVPLISIEHLKPWQGRYKMRPGEIRLDDSPYNLSAIEPNNIAIIYAKRFDDAGYRRLLDLQ